MVRRFENRIYSAVLRIVGNEEEAEEVVQDTFMKAHDNITKFRGSSSFGAWLFRIAHNSCMDRLRTKQRRKLFHAWSFDPQSSAEKEEDCHVVTQAADPHPNPSDELDA